MKQNKAETRAYPQRGKEEAQKRTKRGIVRLVVSLVICLCTAAIVFTSFLQDRTQAAEPTQPSSTQASQPTHEITQPTEDTSIEIPAPTSLKNGEYNLLLASLDEEKNIDLVILNLDNNRKRVTLMGIPRETLIYTSESNPIVYEVYARAQKGKELKTVFNILKDMMGFQLDGYLLVSPQELSGLMNAVGGVPFDVPDELDGSGNLTSGEQTVNAVTAAELLRHKEFDDRFTGSAKLHADFALALLKQLQKKVPDTETAKKLAATLSGTVQTGFTAQDLSYLLCVLQKMNLEKATVLVPKGEKVSPNVESDETYYQLSIKDVLEVLNEYFNPYDKDLTQYDLYIRNENELSTAEGSAYNPVSNGGSSDYTEETEPDYTEPDYTEPDDTEPDNTEPEETEPEETEPEATEPEATEPEETEPEATEPAETEPEPEPSEDAPVTA